MSHSQFRRIEAYTETWMAQSSRQAYDYWQYQAGLSNATEDSAAPCDDMARHSPSSKEVPKVVHKLTSTVFETKQTLPSKRNSPLDTSQPHLETLS